MPSRRGLRAIDLDLMMHGEDEADEYGVTARANYILESASPQQVSYTSVGVVSIPDVSELVEIGAQMSYLRV